MVNWGRLGGTRGGTMRSRFPLSADHGLLAPKRRGIWSRLMGACVLCGVGAVAALELYPQMFSAASSDYGLSVEQSRLADRSADRAVSIVAATKSDRSVASSPRIGNGYTAGPIPSFVAAPVSLSSQPRFAAADEGQAGAADNAATPPPTPSPDKQTRAKNKYAHNSHHSTAKARDRQYRQPPSTWVAGNGVWGAFDYAGRGWR